MSLWQADLEVEMIFVSVIQQLLAPRRRLPLKTLALELGQSSNIDTHEPV